MKNQANKQKTQLKNILFYGPYADEYSLARVNRGLASALHKLLPEVNVKVGSDIAKIARYANSEDFKRNPVLREIEEKNIEDTEWDLVIYNNFPKDHSALHDLADLPGKINCAYLAWEESRFPKYWVDEYNAHLNFVIAASEHTKWVLTRSGVELPIIVVANAIEERHHEVANSNALQEKVRNDAKNLLKTKKRVKFFANNSGLARKGPAELIRAFDEAFSARDDIALIIKTFPSNNNEIPGLLNVRTENSPEIELINESDISEDKLIGLYLNSDAYISPSKAEGFNLPVLEGMRLGIPVVATAWSGQMDFANDENARLLDFELVPATSHLDNPGSYWAQPKVPDLVSALREIYEAKVEGKENTQLKKRIDNARATAESYTWENSAKELIDILSSTISLAKIKTLNLAVISTYNSVCGIAEYSRYQYEKLENSFNKIHFIANKDAIGRIKPDTDNTVRLWEYGEIDFSSTISWLKDNADNLDVVHIQYSEGFYTLDALRQLIAGISELRLPCILTPHAVQEKGVDLLFIKDALELCSQIHVLNEKDVAYLKQKGLKNVVHFPHGNTTFNQQSKKRLKARLGLDENTPIIATHGFMVEKKGILETLQAVKLLKAQFPELKYLAINAINPNNLTSVSMAEIFSKTSKSLGLEDSVIHISDFLDREEIITLLQVSDINIFPYPQAGQSASGTIRLALAAGRPIVVTGSAQLQDANGFGYIIPDNTPEKIAEAATELLENSTIYTQYQMRAHKAAKDNTWDKLALVYSNLISQVI